MTINQLTELTAKEHVSIAELEVENIKLQELWVTFILADPPYDCHDPVVLRTYLKGCVAKANEYEALKEQDNGKD